MSVNRKDFLKVIATGGLGVVFGGAAAIPKFIADKGARLTTLRRQSLLMGSVANFEVVAESEAAGYEAIRKAVKVFRSVERTFSMYSKDSEMGRLSGASGKNAIHISHDAEHVLKFAKYIHRTTRGLFDVTIEPAMKRWGFRSSENKSTERPTDSELRELERLIGSEKIVLDNGKAYLQERGMAIDTGGIAGGYALDKAIKEMKKCDIASAFINFSGDIHCFGKPVDGENWKVHIIDPKTKQPIDRAIELDNKALSTSGAYQNRRGNDSSSWGHILNPAMARPVEPVGSVTAIHSLAMMADAWSTAIYAGANTPEEIETVVID